MAINCKKRVDVSMYRGAFKIRRTPLWESKNRLKLSLFQKNYFFALLRSCLMSCNIDVWHHKSKSFISAIAMHVIYISLLSTINICGRIVWILYSLAFIQRLRRSTTVRITRAVRMAVLTATRTICVWVKLDRTGTKITFLGFTNKIMQWSMERVLFIDASIWTFGGFSM